MDVTAIQDAVQHYFENGIASSTRRCYKAGQQCYIQFCTQDDLTPTPTSENILSLFAAYLARSGLARSIIKIYFSSIGNLHLSHSQQSAYHKALTLRLEQILSGIKKEQPSTRSVRIHLPITVDIMHSIYTILFKTSTQYQAIMLWAAYCITFFGFLRVGEMTVPSQNGYDSSVHLSLGDITLNSRQTPTVVWLTIKTIQNGLIP